MKKTALKWFSVFLAVLMLITQSYSVSAMNLSLNVPEIDLSEFQPNWEQINEAFAEINRLDAYVEQSGEVTYQEIYDSNPDLVSGISETGLPLSDPDHKHSTIIPPFWWGCLLNVAGVLVVLLLTDNDRYEVRRSLFGCLVSSIFFGGGLLYRYL
jgi:hypothetical protein